MKMWFPVIFGLLTIVGALCIPDIDIRTDNEPAVDALLEKLFPMGVPHALHRHDDIRTGRSLAIKKDQYDPQDPVPCAVCTGLSQCKVLNSFMVEEVYYPKDPGRRETCNVIEALGKRVSTDIFGNGRTFRDTEQCRGKIARLERTGLPELTHMKCLVHRYRHAVSLLILR
jgi:hypothetical protein